LIGVIVSEFLIASSGLGYRLNFYSTSCNTNGTFAMTLVMMALMMVSVPKTKFDDNGGEGHRRPARCDAAYVLDGTMY
jgi:hypothetical protein